MPNAVNRLQRQCDADAAHQVSVVGHGALQPPHFFPRPGAELVVLGITCQEQRTCNTVGGSGGVASNGEWWSGGGRDVAIAGQSGVLSNVGMIADVCAILPSWKSKRDNLWEHVVQRNGSRLFGV